MFILLLINEVYKTYKTGGLFSGKKKRILSNVSLECREGECLGIIGESGSGKSTLGRLIMGIEQPDSGTILLDGKPVADRRVRAGRMSAVFQDYTSSINPFYTVERAILEPLQMGNLNRSSALKKVDQLLQQVGLDSSYRSKYPHELSGGEAQRVCIARAISTEPRCILMDEAISSLDGTIQTQILELLQSLRRIYRVSFIFITHDIQAAAYICDRILIMHNGSVEEVLPVEQLKDTQSDYTKRLLQSVLTY